MADELRYAVAPLPVVLDRMATLGRLAGRLGRGEWFIAAMRVIEERLQSQPTTWGDPLRYYAAARLQVYHAHYENFILTYAVHTDRPIVFVRTLELLAGSPLFGKE